MEHFFEAAKSFSSSLEGNLFLDYLKMSVGKQTLLFPLQHTILRQMLLCREWKSFILAMTFEDKCFVECHTMYSGGRVLTFQRVLLPSWWWTQWEPLKCGYTPTILKCVTSPEDSSTHCNCCGNLTPYNTSVECWYSFLWFHISRAQGWIIRIKEFKKIYKLPGDLWVQIIRLERYLRFYIFLIQPVLIVGTSIICHSLLYIHAFACLTILCTCFVYCILCVFCILYWSSEYYWFFSFNVL